jgi:DNA-binding GntR family transcriptional regulator
MHVSNGKILSSSDGASSRTPSPKRQHPQGQNRSNSAYASITEMIRRRELRGGETIVEARLCERLQSSRTPIREALQRLEGEGLVIKNSSRSYVVRLVDLGEFLKSMKVREILEPQAAALAVGHVPSAVLTTVRAEIAALKKDRPLDLEAHWRSDDAVYGAFADHCGNEVLGKMIHSLRTTTRLFEISRLSDRIDPDLREHVAILDALAADDSRSAAKAVQAHLRSFYRFVLELVR